MGCSTLFRKGPTVAGRPHRSPVRPAGATYKAGIGFWLAGFWLAGFLHLCKTFARNGLASPPGAAAGAIAPQAVLDCGGKLRASTGRFRGRQTVRKNVRKLTF